MSDATNAPPDSVSAAAGPSRIPDPMPPLTPNAAEATTSTAADAAPSTPPTDPPAPPPPAPHNLTAALQALQRGDAFEMARSGPLRIASIRIEGASSVRPSFLFSVLRPYVDVRAPFQSPVSRMLYAHRTSFCKPSQATTLQGLLAMAESLGSDLARFELFNDVQARFEPSAHPQATEEDVEVIFTCVPRSRLFLRSNTDIGNGEGAASVQGRMGNLFGGAETLEGSATFGTRTRSAFDVRLSSPVLASPVLNAMLSATATDRDATGWSSLCERTRSIRSALQYTGGGGGGNGLFSGGAQQREFATELSWRQLNRLTSDASVSMRKLASGSTGETIKACVSHTWARDTRDEPVLATRGSYFRTVQEIAGFGGDAYHLKASAQAQMGRLLKVFDAVPKAAASIGVDGDVLPVPTSGGLWGTLGVHLGLLRTLDGRQAAYSDRFHLGGPTSVRMFRHNSLGPRDAHDALGGDAFWSAGASLIASVPRRPTWPLKLHAWLNAGQLCQLDQSKPLLGSVLSSVASVDGKQPSLQAQQPSVRQAESFLSSAARQLAQPSISAGVGLLYTQAALRVELNAGVPLVARRSDGTRKGLQLGVGVEFL